MNTIISKCSEFYEKWRMGKMVENAWGDLRILTCEEVPLKRTPNEEKMLIIQLFKPRVFEGGNMNVL